MLKNLIRGAAALCSVVIPAFAQNDPVPVPPKPGPASDGGIVRQAGVGGNIAFARAGVVELGGSVSGTSATNYQEFSVAPSVGYFLFDNIELTGMLDWRYAKVTDAKAQQVTALLLEPSFQIPLTNEKFFFVGVGFGVLMQTDQDAGGALSPRVGVKHLVGRSGMLTADIRATYGVNADHVQTSSGTVLTVKSAFSIGIGYTVLL